jgi:acetolactate synthase-1/2/3 large subunit
MPLDTATRNDDRLVETVAARIAEWLVERGVQHVFGVGGANIEDVFVAVQARRPTIRAVLDKHEHSAGAAADAYARLRGGFGVVLTTSGGAAMNLVSALAEACASNVPLLAIVGEPPTALQGVGAFQDTSGRGGTIDAAAVLTTVSRWCERVSEPEQIVAQLEHARAVALAERGPAVLLVAKDVQQAACTAAKPVPQYQPHDPDDLHLDRALVLLREGSCVVIAGDEVPRSFARNELASLVERLDARVAVTPDARDAFANDSPRFLGVAGAMGHDQVLRALVGARVCLLIGTRLPILARQGLEPALRELPIAWIGRDPPHVCARELVHIGSDPRPCLQALLAALPHARGDRTIAVPHESTSGSATFDGKSVLAVVEDAMSVQGVVLVDAGNTGATTAHHLAVRGDARWLLAMGMAGMGWTFGAAIGAAYASGRRCTVVAGDGAFLMHGLEIHTAVEHDLPITYVILDNRAHGMCLVRERILLGRDAGYNAFRRSRIGTGLAAMFPRLFARDCDDLASLAAALRSAAEQPGPAVVCARLRDVEVPPFAQFRQIRPDLTTVDRGADREDD